MVKTMVSCRIPSNQSIDSLPMKQMAAAQERLAGSHGAPRAPGRGSRKARNPGWSEVKTIGKS